MLFTTDYGENHYSPQFDQKKLSKFRDFFLHFRSVTSQQLLRVKNTLISVLRKLIHNSFPDPNVHETVEQAEKSNNGPDNCCYWYCNGPHESLCTNCPSILFSNQSNYDGLPRLLNETSQPASSSTSTSKSTALSPAVVHKQQQQMQLHKLQQQIIEYSESRCPIYNGTGPQTCILQYPGPYFNKSSAIKKMSTEPPPTPTAVTTSAAAAATTAKLTTSTTKFAAIVITTSAATTSLLSQLLLLHHNDNNNRIWTVFIIKIVLIIITVIITNNNIQYTILRIAWTNITNNNNQFLLQLAGL